MGIRRSKYNYHGKFPNPLSQRLPKVTAIYKYILQKINIIRFSSDRCDFFLPSWEGVTAGNQGINI